MTLLEVNNLKKSFGELVAVDDLSFHVDAGEVLGLLGPNGAGKSTTMMMLAGLLPPDSGTIRLNGQVLDIDNRESRRVLGVVPQDLAIYPELTGRENLEFFGRLYGIRGHGRDSTRLAGSVDRRRSGHLHPRLKVQAGSGCSCRASITNMLFSTRAFSGRLV